MSQLATAVASADGPVTFAAAAATLPAGEAPAAASAPRFPEQDAFGGLGPLLAGLFLLWVVVIAAVAATV